MKKYIFKKKNLICIIFLLVVFSNTYFLSKYTSSIGNSASRNIANFDVSINTSDNASDTLDMLSGTTEATYTVKVVSRAEVASNYSIILSNVPNGLQVSLDGGTYYTPVNSTIAFNGIKCQTCSFNANDSVSEHIHTLKFYDSLNSNNNGNKSINIDVAFTQVE